jgi:hypothetical protein
VGLIAWFRQQREWHRNHVAAFSLVSQKQADGLSLFQHHAIDAVSQFVRRESFKRIAAEKGSGYYVVAPMGRGAELYIYPNEAGIFGVEPHARFEEWSYATPSDLLQALVKECASRAV